MHISSSTEAVLIQQIGEVLSPDPRFPIEIQLHILSFGWDLENLETSIHYPQKHPEKMAMALSTIQSLYSCSLVCRGWSTISQKFLFRWIMILNHTQLDKLSRVLRLSIPSSSRLLGYIRCMIICYKAPFFMFGQALPCIAALRPPNLSRIDLCPIEETQFPFHFSLPILLSRLDQVRTLRIFNLHFQTSTELRQLICCFRGVRSVDLGTSRIHDFGPDRLGEYRPLSLLGRPTSILCMSPTRLPAAAFPLALWLASPNLHPNSRQHVDGVPTLSRGVAEFLASLHHVLQSSVVATKEKWMWEFNVGEVSNDKQC